MNDAEMALAREIDAGAVEDDAADPEEVYGPDDEAGDPIADEVAAPFARLNGADMAALGGWLRTLEQAKGVKIAPQQAVAMVEALNLNAVRRSQRGAFKQIRRMDPRTALLRNRVLRNFMERHPRGHIVDDEGVYYSTFEVIFQCEGGPDGAIAKIARSTEFDAFVTYVATSSGVQNGTRMGKPYSETPADTNLTQPSATTYVDQVFHIQRCGVKFKGIRVKYAPADIATMTGATGGLAQVVDGTDLTFDDNGIVLPTELWDEYTNQCEIARALAASAVLYFKWNDTGIGNTGSTRSVEVDSFDAIPGIGSRNLKMTSGGAGTKDMPNGGYLWTQDHNYQLSEQNGGNGLFKATLKVETDTTFAFMPISVLGSPAPVVPVEIGLEFQIRLYGTGFRSKNAARRRSGPG